MIKHTLHQNSQFPLLQIVRGTVPDVDGFQVGVVPQVEGAVFDFYFIRENEFVGFVVQTSAGFGSDVD